MTARRIISAILTFALATLLCLPAFAGAWELTAAQGESGCCCSKKEEATHQTVGSLKCDCPACACTINDARPLVPLHAVGSNVSIDLPSTTVSNEPALAIEPIHQLESFDPSVRAARGPPPRFKSPLYIFFDTLRI